MDAPLAMRGLDGCHSKASVCMLHANVEHTGAQLTRVLVRHCHRDIGLQAGMEGCSAVIGTT